MHVDTSRTLREEDFRKSQDEIVELWGWIAQISGQLRQKLDKDKVVQILIHVSEILRLCSERHGAAHPLFYVRMKASVGTLLR